MKNTQPFDRFVISALLASLAISAGASMADEAPSKEASPQASVEKVSAKDAKDAKDAKSAKDAKNVVNAKDAVSQLYSFKEKSIDGSDIDFSKYKGDVLLIVNTASACGFTPQYQGLEELSQKYKDKGLKVLGFPCNQFGAQEPGDSNTIVTFCQKNYGVDFQLFDKIEVNGENADPLYVYLKKEAPDYKGDIRWNFTKFLVDRKGNIYKRFDSKVKPAELASDIEKLL